MAVVIACLLDKFIITMQEVKEQDEKEAREEASTSSNSITLRHGPLDALLKQLLTYASRSDLSAKIGNIWDLVDLNSDGSLSCNEMNKGMALLDVAPPIHLSTEDFFSITQGFLDKDNSISKDGFDGMITRELHVYMERQLVRAIKYSDSANDTGMLCALKLLVIPLFKDVHNPETLPQSATHVFDQLAAQSSVHSPLTPPLSPSDGTRVKADAFCFDGETEREGWRKPPVEAASLPSDPDASPAVTESSNESTNLEVKMESEATQSRMASVENSLVSRMASVENSLASRMASVENSLASRMASVENSLASILKVCNKLAGESSSDARAASLSVPHHRSPPAKIAGDLANRNIVGSKSGAQSLVNTRGRSNVVANLPPGPDQRKEPETSETKHAHSSFMIGQDESAELRASGNSVALELQVQPGTGRSGAARGHFLTAAGWKTM